MAKVYINGRIYDKADAKISVYDHGLLYGDGVFEGIRVYNGKIFRLREHIDRLYDGARSIALEIPISREQMADAMQSTVAANGQKEAYIRALVTRGIGSLGLDPRKCTDPHIIVIVDEIALYPRELCDGGLDLCTVATIRNHPGALNPRVKSLNYLNSILAKLEAIRAGCLECVMLNHLGQVCEGSGDNIFLVRRGELYTPSPDAGILEGITRGVVMELAREARIPVHQTCLQRHDLYTADEIFLTGTAAEVIPAVKVDGRVVGNGKPGPMTLRLREAFQRLTRQ